MKHTMRILTLLLLTMVGTGQAWAEDVVQFGHITYNGTAANDGGTLKFYKSRKVELDGNLITVTNGESDPLTSADWGAIYDENDQIVAYQLFIMATPAVGHRLPNTEVGATVDFIQAEVVTSAQQAPSRRNAPDPTIEVSQTLPVKFYEYYIGGGNDETATEYYGLYYVVMPADANLSVSITATFPEVATNATAIDYVDVDGTTKSKAAGTVYVLDGTEARLGYGSYNDRTQETWYVLPANATYNYTNGLELYGKVHLILADGATMTIGTDSEPIVGTDLYVWGDLDIYGQSGQSGMLTATSSSYNAIHLSSDLVINGGVINAKANAQSGSSVGIHSEHLTINGGTVTSTSTVGDGIYAGYLITINGGTVTATGAESGLSCNTDLNYSEQNSGNGNTDGEIIINGGIVTATGTKRGIRAVGDLIINGGQVTATGGTGGADAMEAGLFSPSGNIILGWTNPTDYIKANSYICKNNKTSGKVVKTADGKALKYTDDDNTVKLIGTVSNVEGLAGRTLTPYGIWGYCGKDDTNTAAVDESKTLTWDIALNDEPTSATDLATTLTIEGCGTMANYTNEAPAPWSDKTIEAANILASADVANVNAIAENIPVTLGYTGPVATTHTFNGYFVRKTADNTNISADVLSHNDQTKVWTLTMPDYAVNVSPKLTRNTTVSVEIVDPVTTIDGHPIFISGDDAHVKVTLNPVAGEGETNLPKINGIVTISTVDSYNSSKSYTVAIVNGEGHYYVTNLGQSVYDITADFDGDANYTASATEDATTLEGCMILTETTSSLDKTSINVGEAVNVSIKINEVGLQRPVIDDETHTNKTIMFEIKQPLSIDAIVTVKCKTPWDNGEGTSADVNNYTTAIVNGQGIRTYSHLPAGPRTINAVFAGNDRHVMSMSKVENLQVNKFETTISVGTNSPVIAKEQNYE